MDEKETEAKLARSKEESLNGMLENIEVHKNALISLEKERDFKKQLFAVTNKNPEIIKAEYKYQEDPEFWKVVKGFNVVLHERELNKIDVDLKRVKKVMKSTIEQYEIMKGGENE